MKFDILRFLEVTHPLKLICVGIFLISLGLNFVQHSRNTKLLKELHNTPKVKIILVPKEPQYQIPRIEQPDNLLTKIKMGGELESIG